MTTRSPKGLMFMIGNPTNIYLATSAGINFVSYFQVMAIPTIVTGLAELAILLLIFFKQLKQPLVSNEIIYPLEDSILHIQNLDCYRSHQYEDQGLRRELYPL